MFHRKQQQQQQPTVVSHNEDLEHQTDGIADKNLSEHSAENGDKTAAASRPRRRKRQATTNSTDASMLSRRRRILLAATILLLLTLLFVLFSKTRRQNNSGSLLVLLAALPIFSAASVIVHSSNAIHQRLVAGFFVGAILCGQLPKFISAALVAFGIFVFGLATRVEEATDHHFVSSLHLGKRAALAAILTTLSLLVENFFVWVVSATYYPSHDGSPTPLQDNGQLLLRQLLFEGNLKRSVVYWRACMNVQWALVAGFAGSMVSVEMQLLQQSKRNIYGLATRALLTLAAVRSIRTVSFLMTVLPSQHPNCYREHFPNPPPDTWKEWISIGLMPQSHGGCNDLIISGHSTVTTVLACISTSLVGNKWYSFGVWVLLALDYSVEVYEGFHYSIDMWIGAIVTCLLWRVMAPIEESFVVAKTKELVPLSSTTVESAIWYGIPTFFAYVGLVITPQSIANFWILTYVLVPGFMLVRGGFLHYVQHLLFCALYIALGTYL